MTDLSRELRAQLAREAAIVTPSIVKQEVSVDGTPKFVLRLGDGRQIESVYIPDTRPRPSASRHRSVARWHAHSA